MPGPNRKLWSEPTTICFLAVLAVWVLTPLAAWPSVAQDSVPYDVAGRFLSSRPSEVYTSWNADNHELPAHYAAAYCAVAQYAPDECLQRQVPYNASPLVLPFAWSLRGLSGPAATLVMRLIGAVMLAGGMLVLFRRLAPRTRWAPLLLVATAIVVTPLATLTTGYGQTSPIFFASLCLGLGGSRSRTRGVLAPLAWVGAVAFKLSPFFLGLIALHCRKWRFLVTAVVATLVLAAWTALIAPASVIGGFIHSTTGIAGARHTGSIESIGPGLFGPGALGRIVGWSIAVPLAAGCCVVGLRRASDDLAWATGYLAIMVLLPKLEWHYMWVPFGVIALVLAEQRKLSDRTLAVLPVVAAFTLVPSLASDPTAGNLPLYQTLYLLGVVVVFIALVLRSEGCGPRRRPRSSTVQDRAGESIA